MIGARRAVFATVLFFVTGLFAPPTYAYIILPPGVDGYKIPGEDVAIQNEYSARDGHPVFFVYLKRDGQTHSDGYDTATGKYLYVNRQKEIDESKGPEALLQYEQKLTPEWMLSQSFSDNRLAIGDQAFVTIQDWQYQGALHFYSGFIQIDRPGAKPIKIAIFTPKARPIGSGYRKQLQLERDLRYQNESNGDLLWDGGKGFFHSGVNPYFVHFDRAGRSNFFNGRDDIVLISADELHRVIEDAKANHLSTQMIVDRADALIDAAFKTQKLAQPKRDEQQHR
jgi:hypothetical protein